MSVTGPLAYAAVYVAAILEGEVVFVAAAVLVAAGKLNALAVMAFGALGAATGDQLFFYAFRGRIAGWLTRSHAVAARHVSIVSRVQRHQSLMILAIRFLPGLRIAITAACAYGNVSPVRFSTLNLVSAFAWSFVSTMEGVGIRTADDGRKAALAAARVTAAAAQFRHVLGFFAVFRTVLAEFTVWRDRAGTTRMSALLRLIHNAPLLAGSTRTIVAQHAPGRATECAGPGR